jgi:proline dehydrogenase
LFFGAEGETRTPTALRPLDPEPSVSTNSTTSAETKVFIAKGHDQCNRKKTARSDSFIDLVVVHCYFIIKNCINLLPRGKFFQGKSMLLRQTLLFLSRRKELEDFFKNNPAAKQARSRFIAGNTRAEALAVTRHLNESGFKVTLDYLGEEVTDAEQARAAAEEYAASLEEAAREGLDTGVSIKLSHLGICVDEGLAYDNLLMIVERAAEVGRFVRVDMEGSDLTERTLAMVRQIHKRFQNIGAVIQSSLRRSGDDTEILCREKIPIRLVKGAYLEPKEVAFQSQEEASLYFMRLVETLMRDGTRPAIATHDEKLIEFAIDMAFIFGLKENDYEFQMLYGIRRDLQQKLLQKGYRVRIYLPYGDDWYGYFMRRLAERPANLWFLLKNLGK